MGDDLTLKEREALRTPMQWSNTKHGGFTSYDKPFRPVIADGEYGYPTLNVAAARRDPDSLLQWFERMIRTLRECPEVGTGVCSIVPVTPPSVLAHRMEAPQGTLLFLHNLGDADVTVDVGEQPGQEGDPVEVFSDRPYDEAGADLTGIAVGAHGYRWLRLRRTA
jgi:maltose alpha-D-glucosyltransferase/alpha-amylase